MSEDVLSEEASMKRDEPGGIPAKTEASILSKLLFDEGEFLARLEETIGRAMKFFRIERSGRVVLQEAAKRVKVKDQIRLLLAGRYFAMKLQLVPNEKMNYREIAVELNRPPNGISPEVSELIREGDLVRDEEGLVAMPFHRIDSTLRELEQPQLIDAEQSGSVRESPRRNGTRRAPRARMDPIVQAMLEKPTDLSEYTWVPHLPKALDKGLAALHIAKEKFGVDEMSCAQMATFLSRTFPVGVTRAAINMAFLEVRSRYVAPASKGKEITYSLLPLGRQHLLEVANQAAAASMGGSEKESSTRDSADSRNDE